MSEVKILNNKVVDYTIQQTLPDSAPNKTLPAQPIWKTESSIAVCENYDLTSLSKKSATSPFTQQVPFLCPPSKELIIKASEAVRVFIQPEAIQTYAYGKKDPNDADDLREESQEEMAEIALSEDVRKEHEIKDGERLIEEDEEYDSPLYRRRNTPQLVKRSEKTGKEPVKELLSLVSEQEVNLKEELAKEEELEDVALREQKKQDALAKEKDAASFNPDRSFFQALATERTIHNRHSLLAFDELNFSRKYSQNLTKELNDLQDALAKRTKQRKVLNWIAKAANIFAGGSAIAVAAIALASGVGAFLAVIPASAKLFATGVQLGADVMKLQNKHYEAAIVEGREHRHLANRKAHELLSESGKAINILHTLWRTSSDIFKNMIRATSNITKG